MNKRQLKMMLCFLVLFVISIPANINAEATNELEGQKTFSAQHTEWLDATDATIFGEHALRRESLEDQ